MTKNRVTQKVLDQAAPSMWLKQ